MEGSSNSIKRKGDGEQEEGKSGGKRQNVIVRMFSMEVFECTICSKPLRPPIYLRCKGKPICSPCHDNLSESDSDASDYCYIMDRIVKNMFVSCKHGCSGKVTYYRKEEHERGCPFGPCVCPVSGCSFVAATAALQDHLTILHKLPTTSFKLYQTFEVPVQPGSRVLKSQHERLFLLNVESPQSYGHLVSLVCVQPETPGADIYVHMSFSCVQGHYQESRWEMANDGVAKQSFCLVPGGETDVKISITIESPDDYEYDD